MGRSFLASFLLVFLSLFVANGQYGDGQYGPAMYFFGDSGFDVGNNNNLFTLIKSNFPPYGRDFPTKQPTGRFCNGKLACDFAAERLQIPYPQAYLSSEANGNNLLTGANFASAASGYFDATAELYNTISLSQQLENYREYQNRLVEIAGRSNASTIRSDAVYYLSAGSSDFLQNYYINPLLQLAFTFDRFSDILMQSYTNFIQRLYALGARRVGVTTLPPMGCLPAAMTIFGLGSNECLEWLNNEAVSFNNRLNATSHRLQNQLFGLKLIIFDIYRPLYNISTNPTAYGFAESRKACCGTGLLETSILCNPFSVGTCANASDYVFWDGFHPSDAANGFIAESLLESGMRLVS
ncbi:GDSL esterase/lipase At5g22810-like [Corylus avellana]|uniref:GDSL esterase/lipase At5g22810-like n=1 Tax=Corylus avellana TaxID=13451 RepID=UPI00286C35D5|nr:GDSL esterase/lipase At5g22810-like [Corylus avellana]XP_059429024.1 GDSL esterase/lipase At5g22810-like [Corylus avellana]